MTAEIGQYALILAMVIAGAQAIIPMIGAARRDYQQMVFATYAAVAQLFFLGLAFVMLAQAFVTSDFSLLVVASNSNTAMPFFYRLAATWGNHEGSLLLWVTILALFGAGLALFARNLPVTLKARVLAVQAAVSTGFLILAVFTSNPFERLHPVPANGQELNPLLQDVGLVMHPPFLYLGYVGFSVAFSFAVAALIEGRIDAVWARFLRPWVLAAWIFLTIGITLGSFWAYYELGWGGWWFWDPVENASFMPWLAGTALLHSAIVVERRQSLIVWTLLLAILTFSLSLIGTFLVRSGIITSVHAFAVDPVRGAGILALIVVTTGGALTLFSLRAGTIERTVPFKVVSREGGLVLNNILLVVGCGTVFLGTFYPLVVEMLGPEKISVGAPYFNRSFVPIMVPLLLAVAIGPMLRWKRDRIAATLGRMKWVVGLTLVVALAILAFAGLSGLGATLGLALGAWLIFASLFILVQRMRLADRNWRRSLQALASTPRATYGMVLAHLGLGLFVVGVTTMTAWQQERILSLAPGESIDIAHLSVTLDDVTSGAGDNYQFERGHFTVASGGAPLLQLTSERRFYPDSRRVTTEAAIRPRGLSNIYVAMGEANDAGKWVVRIYYHPLVLLIWLGPVFMAAGGTLSLADRRMRVGAPAAKRVVPNPVRA